MAADRPDRQPAPAEAGEDQGLLRRLIAHAPRSRRQHAEITTFGQRRRILGDDLRVVGEVGRRRCSLAARSRAEGVGRRRDGGAPVEGQILQLNPWVTDVVAGDGERATTLPERVDRDPEGRGADRCRNVLRRGPGEPNGWIAERVRPIRQP
jgi:hypothetical protein